MTESAQDKTAITINRIDPDILLIRLNRPDQGNLINQAMQFQLAALFGSLNDESDIRAVVLAGTGGTFSAGEDFDELAQEVAQSNAGASRSPEVLRAGGRLFRALLDLQLPVVARVNGPALGLGATLTLLADVVVMAESASIGDNHVDLGVVAGDGGALIWPQVVGLTRAKEMLLTGRLISAQEAVQIGLATTAVRDADLAAEAHAAARRLADQPSFAVRATKMAVNRAIRGLAEDVLDVGLEWQRLSLQNARNIDSLGWLRRQQERA